MPLPVPEISDPRRFDRRRFLIGSSLFVACMPVAAEATPVAMTAAIDFFTGGAMVRKGRVRIDLPPLVDNGNSAPLGVTVDSPMTASDYVKTIRVFNQKNPQADVITCHLGPRSGQAKISTRIKLADSQVITAIAQMSDGSFWSASADVIVTIAACIEEPT